MNHRKHPDRYWSHLISMPIIWSVAIPVVILDIWVEIYHRTCFPLYGIPYVKRSQFIRIDRHRLEYLPWQEKLGCAYCGYVNGFCSYMTVIAGRTEEYWCGIKHRAEDGFTAPAHHQNFLEYGDEEAYNNIGESTAQSDGHSVAVGER